MIEDFLYVSVPKPGFSSNGTTYQSKGRWHEGNLIRFTEGSIQPIGGWIARGLTGDALAGTVIAAITWQLQDGTPYLAVGTTEGLYVIDNDNVCTDITPIDDIADAPYDWQLSIFGAYLMAVNSQRGDADLAEVNTYVWTGEIGTPAVAAWTDDIGPKGAYAGFATPERFFVVLRALDPTDAPERTGIDSIYSERRVWWPSQEQLDEFISTDTNTGGSFDLQTDGRLVIGCAARGQSLLWTDVDLWTMTYIGGELIYQFQNVGQQCGIVGKNAFVTLDKGAFWMGRGKFFVYNGFVQPIPCEVTDHVFGDFNGARAHTVFAVANARFNEITWYYPAAGAQYPNRYVTYNHVENHWVFGEMERNAGVPQRFRRDVIDETVPVLFGPDGVLYEHETGLERSAQAWLASGPIELGAGDRLMRIQGIMPDNTIVGSLGLKLYTALAPNALEILHGPYALGEITALRLTARQVRIRLEDAGANSWRIGNFRLAVRPVERRGGGTASLDLTPVSIEVVPDEVTLTQAQHYTFQAIVRNAAGEVLPIPPDTWVSSQEQLPIDGTGTVTALAAPLTAVVYATLGELVSNNATVTVEPGTPTKLIITPDALQLSEDVESPLAYSFRNALGQVILGLTPDSWTSDNEDAATVDEDGILTGVTARSNLFSSDGSSIASSPWTHSGTAPTEGAATYAGMSFTRVDSGNGVVAYPIAFPGDDAVYITIFARSIGAAGAGTVEGALYDITDDVDLIRYKLTIAGNGAITAEIMDSAGTLVRSMALEDKAYGFTFSVGAVDDGHSFSFKLRDTGTAAGILLTRCIGTSGGDSVAKITAGYSDESLTSNASAPYTSDDVVIYHITDDTTADWTGDVQVFAIGAGGGGAGETTTSRGGGGGGAIGGHAYSGSGTLTVVVGQGHLTANGDDTTVTDGTTITRGGGGLKQTAGFYAGGSGSGNPPVSDFHSGGGHAGAMAVSSGGGGAGAGLGGYDATPPIGGVGGDGFLLVWEGFVLGYFGGGGGGGSVKIDTTEAVPVGGAGGVGGGGHGGAGSTPGTDGDPHTGGGGGGGGGSGSTGGSGRAIILHRPGEATVTVH